MSSISLDTDGQRFVMTVDGHHCELGFSRSGQVVSMNHVQVPDAVGGRGLASELTRHALDWAGDQNLAVRPVCPYVARWIERHPEYQNLVEND
ncbi:MAG: GNAT family N-acetyltransferase [Wenzhouxiangella sp.]